MALTLHGYINTTKMCAENVDAMNCAGIYASGDVDNGTIVTLSSMNKATTTNLIQGYEYTVALAGANPTGPVWVVASPEVGTTIDQQILSDPRYFYNAAGQTMSLKYLVEDVDCIEVTAECFDNNTIPASTSTTVTIVANGQLHDNGTSAASGAGAGYFSVEGFHTVTIGMTEVPAVVLRFHRVAG